MSKIFPGNGKIIVWGTDTLSGRAIEIAADLVVLATPMVPAAGAAELGQTLHISTDADGFFNEAHPKLRPVETLTAGIFLAGTGQGPRTSPRRVAQASGAAAKVLQLFSQRRDDDQSPTVAPVIAELCAACGACVGSLPVRGARHPSGAAHGHGERGLVPELRRLRGGLPQQGQLRAQLAARTDNGDAG